MNIISTFAEIATYGMAAAGLAATVGLHMPATETWINPEPAPDVVNVQDGYGGDSPAIVAAEYAASTGLTNCGKPEDGELDSTYLMMRVDADMTPTGAVFEGPLDVALDSAGKRVVILACDSPR